jgi:hypothetical protein
MPYSFTLSAAACPHCGAALPTVGLLDSDADDRVCYVVDGRITEDEEGETDLVWAHKWPDLYCPGCRGELEPILNRVAEN